MFEDNATKRQLALLSCAIKGAACHTDMLLVAGRANVVMDSFGAMWVCRGKRGLQGFRVNGYEVRDGKDMHDSLPSLERMLL